MMTEAALQSDLAIPPGEYISEVLEEYGMSQAELARRMGRPAQAVNEIVKGDKAITPDTALQLEKALGLPAALWLGLESQYQLTKARQTEGADSMLEVGLVDEFPYREMVKLRWVTPARKPADKVLALRGYLGVSSLGSVQNVHAYNLAFRKKGKASPYAVAAWLRHAELEAIKTPTAPFSLGRLKALLPEIRALTALEPEVFLPKLYDLLASCGVALVIQPHLPKTYAHGAVFWVGDKAVLVVTIRGKWADIFWFTLFHEIGHLVLHGKKSILEEDNSDDPEFTRLEEEANCFSRNTLIAPGDYESFIWKNSFTYADVSTFARHIGVHAGIVVGRLQYDKHLPPTHLHSLRQQYIWKTNASKED
ncbi:HigA family addiction module antitoxin [uncultured Meiothermus sp.]|jgi:HTH-type transcriptional regulator/antitoxin HigA|uniref:HigA family addiction module antitoxin n=1 Tax=uncultured Meiothermus sp. TaxID=157471 RepID=UPI00260B3CB8|nr:HigA family addiction module antitoxin [uncultured Meiothermus sp.]